MSSQSLLISHAVLTSSAFLLFFPLGALFTRLNLPVPILSYHAPSQILALFLSIAGVSIGIPLAHLSGYSISANAHTLIGLVVVFSLLAFQPIGGWLQHQHSKRYAGRGVQGTLHVWFGRAMIVLGIVNGGLGLQMAGDTGLDRARAYIGVAATVGVLYGIALISNVWSTKSVGDVVALPEKGDAGEKSETKGENGGGYA